MPNKPQDAVIYHKDLGVGSVQGGAGGCRSGGHTLQWAWLCRWAQQVHSEGFCHLNFYYYFPPRAHGPRPHCPVKAAGNKVMFFVFFFFCFFCVVLWLIVV